MQACYFYGREKEKRAEIALPPEESDELVDCDEENDVGVNLDESRCETGSEWRMLFKNKLIGKLNEWTECKWLNGNRKYYEEQLVQVSRNVAFST